MKTRRPKPFRSALATVLALLSAITFPLSAAPPDLTTGGVPNESPAITFNLGPTGLRGWAYHVKVDTGEARQILVTAVASGSPASGTVAVGDVILGASGTAANPANFSSDARKSLALAIADAEARTPASLKLLRWRSGSTTTVTLALQTLGAYSATAPYNCPKSALILQNGLQYVYNSETAGLYSFGAIALLANGNATYKAKAQTAARALVPSQSTMNQMKSDVRDASSMITWQRGHTLVFLAEYYLATGDSQVLPAIEAYAVNIAKNQSLFGTVGHIFAEKNNDGSANGPMGGVYGVVNSAGMPCFLGVLLAKECGLTNPQLDPAIATSSRFFAYYTGKGAVPYGEHEPYIAHESNGKSGLAALYFGLQNNRVEEGKFFAKMATASSNERESGHTGSFFNYLWAPLGAAAGGEEAAAAYFSRISWMLDLNRSWNGKFEYDCLNGEGPNSGSTYNDFRMSTAALLTYALPLRKLRITGKGHDNTRWLSSTDVAEAIAANDYDADPLSNSQLISDLGNWSPKVRQKASKELDTRSISTSELNQITAMATNTAGSSRSRAGACLALGEIGNSGSAAPLAALLTDSDNYVRFAAAEAMRYLPKSANLAQLSTILAAADSTAAPLYPMVEDDPLHFAHGKLAMLLFYSWSAYGPKGILYDSVNGVNRNQLYPAIRAIAKTPVGLSRGTLEKTYDNLTYSDVLELSGDIVDSVIHRAPADKMFSNGVRRGGVAALRKHGIAEGVPACMIFAGNEAGGRRNEGLQLLGTFGGKVHTVEPDPDAVGFLTGYLSDSETAATAQTALAAIAADPNPTPLTALKSIQSVIADDPTVNLPASSTTLRVNSTDHAQGDSVFTWSLVSGPGGVSFTPNGNEAAANSSVQFDGTPGVYEFRVKMSDSRDLTEATGTVTVAVVAPTVNVPDVVGQTQSAAQSTITSAGLTVGNVTIAPSPGVPAGSVISQNPGNGTSVLSGATVDMVVSSGIGGGDTTPPTPNPANFASAPAAGSATAISMEAAVGSDTSWLVEYLFTEISGNPGGNSSAWQSSPSYTDNGLTPTTTYRYTVTMRDSLGNTGTPSAVANATTPAAPDVTAPTVVSFADGVAGGPITVGDPVTYTVTFSEAMNATTVGTADFKNNPSQTSPATITVDSVGTTANPAVFQVTVTTTGPGPLQLQVAATATLEDPAGNALVAATASPDNNAIDVNAVPNLAGQYGILDVTANGGINPNTGNPWQAGDQYRLAFHTADKFDAASSDPAVYNARATAQANLSTLGNGSIKTSTGWTALISTTTTTAKVNTGTADLTGGSGQGGAGVPVYAMDGSTCIARNNADIWNTWSNPFANALNGEPADSIVRRTVAQIGSGTTNVYYSPFLNQYGAGDSGANHGVDVWTGSNSNGTPLAGQEAGSVAGIGGSTGTTNTGSSNANNSTRIWNRANVSNIGNTRSFYAISGLLTVQATVVADNYLSWATANGVTGGANGDSNNNGIKNLVEYALIDGGGRGVLNGYTITFTKRGAPYGSDVSYIIETSETLADDWTTAVIGVVESPSSISYTFTPGSPEMKFARLKVVQAP